MTAYVLTLISDQAIAPRLKTIAGELNARQLNVKHSQCLNPNFSHSKDHQFADAYAVEFDADLDPGHQKKLAQHLSDTFTLDAVIQPTSAARIPKKLACFDMDSTLIQHEVMDELAYRYGIGEKIAAITESAMRGKISFKQSFNQRLACLEGFDASLIPDIAQSLKLMPGAKTLIKTLRTHGVKIAIVSGGFEHFAHHLQESLGEMDAIYSNALEIKNGQLTGKISNQLVDETRKRSLIEALGDQYSIGAAQIIAVGDGANDIPMILHAGLGVAYHAKPIVREKARHCISYNDLSAILYILGYTSTDFQLT